MTLGALAVRTSVPRLSSRVEMLMMAQQRSGEADNHDLKMGGAVGVVHRPAHIASSNVFEHWSRRCCKMFIACSKRQFGERPRRAQGVSRNSDFVAKTPYWGGDLRVAGRAAKHYGQLSPL
jgi:hypothetical protein